MKQWNKRIVALVLAVALIAGLVVCAVQSRNLHTSNGNTSLDAGQVLTPGAAQPAVDNQQPDADAQQDASAQPEQNVQQPAAQLPEGAIAVDTIDTEDRDELEQIVTILDPSVSGDKLQNMDDQQVQDLAQELVEKLEESESSKVVDLGITEDKQTTPEVEVDPDNYDEDGAMTAPFDQLYPELIEQEKVEYDEQTLLIKMSNSRNGAISSGMSAAGVAQLTAIVPLDEATWYEAKLYKDTDITSAVETLRGLSEVMLVDYNYTIQTAAIDSWKPLPEDKGFDNNKHHDDQWHMHHCGIPDGIPEMTTDGGDSGVVVAVIDTGVDYDHEDLADNIWINRGEIPDDGIDNDGNGYIDDYYGANVITDQGNGDDDNGHGTHVAGIIAAQNNNLGVVGLAYNVKIMPIKAAMASGYLNQADIAEAIIYAYNHGADVINMSFGGTASSIAVQDALALAYTRSVLVASAGNNGAPNEGLGAIPNYPAALTYVLGVMSVDQNGVESAFTNYDVAGFNGVEYELYAPGNEIMSTLPNDTYGILSGTSMAAPVVSAMAAILRSEFSDPDTYPTRFIYGQLASTSGYNATCLNPEVHGVHNLPQIVNLYSALTVMPQPELGLQDYHLFDTEGFEQDTADKNNGDGVIDAGETIALGLTLRNRWGQSKDTMVTLDTKSFAGIEDPYITILNPTVDYGSIGTYATGDCGRIYTDEIITAWENPFYIQIAEDCPNDYIFNLNVTITCGNDMDPNDTETYTFGNTVTLTVRSGMVLPTIIDEDMTLTKDNLYIIPNSTIIEEGVTVTVEPGTHIQFWSDDAKDPYATNYIAYLQVDGKFLVEGTAEEPVMIYPSQLMDHYKVDIRTGNTGYTSLRYADVTNLSGSSISYAEHTTFRMNYNDYLRYRELYDGVVRDYEAYGASMGSIGKAVNCAFYKLALQHGVQLSGNMEGCIFVDSGITYYCKLRDCVLLGNFAFEHNYEEDAVSSVQIANPEIAYWNLDYAYDGGYRAVCVAYWPETGTTYFYAPYYSGTIHELLEDMGGSLAIIETQEELQWLQENLEYNNTSNPRYYGLGLEYNHDQKCFTWHDGTPLGEFIDPEGLLAEPDDKICLAFGEIKVDNSGSGYYLYEIPGEILPTEITFKEYESVLDLETTYQIAPVNKPVQLPTDMFLYESSDENVLTVDENGLVTPVALGTANVTVYSKDKAVFNYISFEVKDYVALENILFAQENRRIAVGEIVANACDLYPADTTRRNVTYTSSNEAVVKVDIAGNLTGAGSGTATITATCEGISAEMTVTVFKKATALSFVEANDVVSLVAEEGMEMPEEGRTIPLPRLSVTAGAETDLIWESTDTAVAEITDEGILLKTGGSTAIIVRDANSGLSAQQLLYVVQQPLSGVAKLQYVNGYGTYALLENGDLYRWEAKTLPERRLQNVKDFYQSPNSSSIVVLKTDNTLYRCNSAYGNNWNYAMNDFGGAISNYFVQKSPVGIVTMNNGYIVWTEDGTAYAWGDYSNEYGQLGVGYIGGVSEPAMVNLDAKIVDVKMNYWVTAFLTDTGDLYAVGGHDYVTDPVLVARNVTNLELDGSNYITYVSGGQAYDLSENLKPFTIGKEKLDQFDRVFRMVGYNEALALKGEKLYYYNWEGSDEDSYWEEIPGTYPNVTDMSCYDGHYYWATADGTVYYFDGSVLEKIPLGVSDGETITLTGTNLDTENVLTQDALVLSFNKSINTHGVVNLYADGAQTPATASHQFNKLTISKSAGFEPGVEYTLKITANKFVGEANAKLAEDFVLTFYYEFGGNTGEDSVDTPQIVKPVIHESQTDESVVRYWTAESLYESIMAVQEEKQINPAFNGNAVLNRISTDFEVNHWLRPLASSYEPGGDIALGGNYWATTNEKAIGLQMIDYTDFVNYGKFVYEPYLTEAPENTFPFVTSVTVTDKNGEVVDTAGMEEVTIRVTFNRDMDTTIPLDVRFGSAYPYADYLVSNGDYVDARTWEGKYFISTVIGNGYQYFTIGNGRSATDDLELYTDRQRFLMHVDTTAAQALIMQGNAAETGIELSWTQDDFDTLMGYNVYRSTSEDGYYQRVNSTVIPADTMEFFDNTVEPGVLYYYNFTVVQTDLSESVPSGKIMIRAKDTMAPDIYHTPAYTGYAGESLVISATVTDNLSISYASVFYRTVGQTQWNEARMNNLNSKFSAVIPANQVTTDGIEYYIMAFDGYSYTFKGSEETPFVVNVTEALDTNSLGDVNGDGKISVFDALLLLQGINDLYNLTQEEFDRADLNGNDMLEAVEALRILQYVNGTVGSLVM